MTPNESALPFWALISALQRTADIPHLDYRSWVADEQLTELFERGHQSDLTLEEVAKFGRQTRYRTRKHFDRQRLLQRYASQRETARASHDASEARDAVAWVHRRVTAADWRLLTQLADGSSYEVLAAERGVSVGTLKSYASRLRAAIRQQSPMTTGAL